MQKLLHFEQFLLYANIADTTPIRKISKFSQNLLNFAAVLLYYKVNAAYCAFAGKQIFLSDKGVVKEKWLRSFV